MSGGLPYSINPRQDWFKGQSNRIFPSIAPGPVGFSSSPLDQTLFHAGASRINQAIGGKRNGGSSKTRDISTPKTNIPITQEYQIDVHHRPNEYTCLKTYAMIRRPHQIKQVSIMKNPQVIISISMQNRLLNIGDLALRYEKDKICNKILNDFRGLGQTKQDLITSGNRYVKTLVEPFDVACESIFYNDWKALENNSNEIHYRLEEGQTLFYVLRRVKRKDKLPLSLNRSNDSDSGCSNKKRRVEKDSERKTIEEFVNKKFPIEQVIVDGDSKEKVQPRQQEEEQVVTQRLTDRYWRWEPRVGNHGQLEAAYYDWNSEVSDPSHEDFFVGSFIRVGFVTRFHNRIGENAEAAGKAYDSLFGTHEDLKTWKEQKIGLPELVVQVHMI